MTRVKELVAGETELDRVWGRRGDYFRLFMSDYRKSLSNLDPVLVELSRLRISSMVESRFDSSIRYVPAREAGLSEMKISLLEDYPSSGLFSERERIVLEFTEQWVIQSSSISDEDVDRVQTVLTPEEFIYFCKALSVMDQFARANSIFDIEPSNCVSGELFEFESILETSD